ncbi:hypothetical protein FRB99_007715 [Tulasnella sp. 403]|nr:hypothetical protein FRB99_007715 [Tulasnella sp. 403]
MPAITVITSLPPYITAQEHSQITSKTPEDFSSIPPVLRHKQENVSVQLEPPIPELSSDNAKGTLYVIESVLAFMTPSNIGFQIPYPKITLHAVSRAGDSNNDGPSVYCQLDENPENADLADDEDAAMSELRIYPGDMNGVEAIFEALSHCASLHPDPNPPKDDEEEDDAFIDADESTLQTFSGNQDQELSEVGRAALAHLESVFQPRSTPDDEQDAEGEDEEDATSPLKQNDTQ